MLYLATSSIDILQYVYTKYDNVMDDKTNFLKRYDNDEVSALKLIRENGINGIPEKIIEGFNIC